MSQFTSCQFTRQVFFGRLLVGETATSEIPDITELAPTTETGCNSTNANATAQTINNLISGKTTAPLTWSEDTTKGDLVSEMSNLIGKLWNGWLIKLAIAGSLIGYGIYLFNVRHCIWTFDKKTGQLIQDCQKLGSQSTQEYPLSHIAGISYKVTNSKMSNCNVFLWHRDGENLRHRKLYLAKGERMTQPYTLLDIVRPFCNKDYQIMEWGDRSYAYAYAYGERTPIFLKLCFGKVVSLFSSDYRYIICADKKQDTLTIQSGKNASINWHCVLSRVTEIQVHKREFKDNDGDSHFTHEIYLDLKGEKVRFPINYLNLEAMQFLGEFLDVPVKEVEVT